MGRLALPVAKQQALEAPKLLGARMSSDEAAMDGSTGMNTSAIPTRAKELMDR